ncbi:uncharacterized protein LOC104890183 isoform X4 [Beta vulgaris subsp. vulgaris]|uniref:uncharacterized protein LOC104890183 isoform X4 n=1 Tax=Beta vulgaris subsp. vulgaris TaxID=3555 RepID=UPI002547A091|nr:uncharacterized protein LOC104890183 isoform X4 [Beta vulgaris subsp. vulgaris]
MVGKSGNLDLFQRAWVTIWDLQVSPKVREVWEMAGLTSKLPNGDGASWLDSWDEWQEVEKDSLVALSYVAYYVWHRRNKVVFEDWCRPNEQVAALAMRAVADFNEYSQHIYGSVARQNARSSKVWQPPPAGCVKLNVDASIGDDGWVGMGVVARNDVGEVLFAATRRVKAWRPVEVAEGKALCLAIKLARSHDLQNVIFETDCLTITNRLSRGALFFFLI